MDMNDFFQSFCSFGNNCHHETATKISVVSTDTPETQNASVDWSATFDSDDEDDDDDDVQLNSHVGNNHPSIRYRNSNNIQQSRNDSESVDQSIEVSVADLLCTRLMTSSFALVPNQTKPLNLCLRRHKRLFSRKEGKMRVCTPNGRPFADGLYFKEIKSEDDDDNTDYPTKNTRLVLYDSDDTPLALCVQKGTYTFVIYGTAPIVPHDDERVHEQEDDVDFYCWFQIKIADTSNNVYPISAWNGYAFEPYLRAILHEKNNRRRSKGIPRRKVRRSSSITSLFSPKQDQGKQSQPEKLQQKQQQPQPESHVVSIVDWEMRTKLGRLYHRKGNHNNQQLLQKCNSRNESKSFNLLKRALVGEDYCWDLEISAGVDPAIMLCLTAVLDNLILNYIEV